MHSIQVTIQTGDDPAKVVEIKKLGIMRYAEMLKAFKELPKHVSGLAGKKNDQILEQIPYLLGVALPDILQVIVIATGISLEEVETLGIDEITDLILAIMEVNNYQAVFDKIKKALAQKSDKPLETKTS